MGYGMWANLNVAPVILLEDLLCGGGSGFCTGRRTLPSMFSAKQELRIAAAIPGHGGILDRIDNDGCRTAIFNACCYWCSAGQL